MTDYTPGQPMPNAGTGAPIQRLVINDLKKRMELGRKKYGTLLYAHNGRDALKDAYEEVLDLACYLKQVLMEQADTTPIGLDTVSMDNNTDSSETPEQDGESARIDPPVTVTLEVQDCIIEPHSVVLPTETNDEKGFANHVVNAEDIGVGTKILHQGEWLKVTDVRHMSNGDVLLWFPNNDVARMYKPGTLVPARDFNAYVPEKPQETRNGNHVPDRTRKVIMAVRELHDARAEYGTKRFQDAIDTLIGLIQ